MSLGSLHAQLFGLLCITLTYSLKKVDADSIVSI
jgi:hypothetical protein